jgi:hypothetical protein
LAACLGIVHLGLQSAREARDSTRAQEICDSVMSLIASGILDPNSVQGQGRTPGDIWSQAGVASLAGAQDLDLQWEEEQWLVSIASEQTMEGLLKVTVTVSENAAVETPLSFTLVRLLRDPLFVESLGQNATTGAAP